MSKRAESVVAPSRLVRAWSGDFLELRRWSMIINNCRPPRAPSGFLAGVLSNPRRGGGLEAPETTALGLPGLHASPSRLATTGARARLCSPNIHKSTCPTVRILCLLSICWLPEASMWCLKGPSGPQKYTGLCSGFLSSERGYVPVSSCSAPGDPLDTSYTSRTTGNMPTCKSNNNKHANNLNKNMSLVINHRRSWAGMHQTLPQTAPRLAVIRKNCAMSAPRLAMFRKSWE